MSSSSLGFQKVHVVRTTLGLFPASKSQVYLALSEPGREMDASKEDKLLSYTQRASGSDLTQPPGEVCPLSSVYETLTGGVCPPGPPSILLPQLPLSLD